MHNAALRELGLDDWRYQHLPLPPELLRGDRARARARRLPRRQRDDPAQGGGARAGRRRDRNSACGRRREHAHVRRTAHRGRQHGCDRSPAGDPAPGTTRAAGAPSSRRRRRRRGPPSTPSSRPARRTCRSGTGPPSGPSALASELGGRAVRSPEPADIVVQCTSVGLTIREKAFKALPMLPPIRSRAGTCVVDMVYRAGGTAFLAAARSRGADVVDGLEILVAQGAASLERWTGRPAPDRRDAAGRDRTRPSA